MTDKIKFTFLARPDDLIALTNLAGACDRSRAAVLRKLIRDANKQQQKTSSIAASWPADAIDEANPNPARADHTKEIQETDNAELTPPRRR